MAEGGLGTSLVRVHLGLETFLSTALEFGGPTGLPHKSSPCTAAGMSLSSWHRSFSMKSLLDGYLQGEEKEKGHKSFLTIVQCLNRCSALKIQKLEKSKTL